MKKEIVYNNYNNNKNIEKKLTSSTQKKINT